MLVHNFMQYRRLKMNHDFDAVGIVLHFKVKLRLITMYISPDKSFQLNNLVNMFGNPYENT